MVKLANPLNYPLAMLVSGIFLVVGVRLVRLPSVVAIPGAVAIALGGSTVLKQRQADQPLPDNAALASELQALRRQAQALMAKSAALKAEATEILTTAHQMDLLVTVQYACDRSQELPDKLDQLAGRMRGEDALLSVDELKQQLKSAEAKAKQSQGVAKQQWLKLTQQLRENMQLAQQGQNARQAQLASLSTLIAEAEGVLQTLQNKLRTDDLSQTEAADELRRLSDEFQGFQENVEVLVS